MLEYVVTYFALPVITIAVLIVFIRLAKGPSVEDRIVALDLLTSIGISFFAVFAIATSSVKIIDVGIILALIAFLSTVAFAYYLERSSRK
jgi:multicomponent Na+:H+ antiporter subunit F